MECSLIVYFKQLPRGQCSKPEKAPIQAAGLLLLFAGAGSMAAVHKSSGTPRLLLGEAALAFLCLRIIARPGCKLLPANRLLL